MNRTLAAILCVVIPLVCLISAEPAAAQAPPFFGRGATIFDPEIGVVQSGVLNDVQATVSGDRKYVTMTTRATNAQLLALREFTFQVGNGAPQGFVGGAGAAAVGAGQGNGANAGSGVSRASGAASRKVVRPSVLDQPGMTLLGRLPAAPRRLQTTVDPPARTS
jgi:hypothetical protein